MPGIISAFSIIPDHPPVSKSQFPISIFKSLIAPLPKRFLAIFSGGAFQKSRRGQPENSPVFQHRVAIHTDQVPKGTAELIAFITHFAIFASVSKPRLGRHVYSTCTLKRSRSSGPACFQSSSNSRIPPKTARNLQKLPERSRREISALPLIPQCSMSQGTARRSCPHG